MSKAQPSSEGHPGISTDALGLSFKAMNSPDVLAFPLRFSFMFAVTLQLDSRTSPEKGQHSLGLEELICLGC